MFAINAFHLGINRSVSVKQHQEMANVFSRKDQITFAASFMFCPTLVTGDGSDQFWCSDVVMDQCKILSDVAKWLIRLSIHQSQVQRLTRKPGRLLSSTIHLRAEREDCFCLFGGCSLDSFVFLYISVLLWRFIYGSVIIVYQWLIIFPQQKFKVLFDKQKTTKKFREPWNCLEWCSHTFW